MDAPLPKEVETGGKRYAINTDWRVALRIFTALEDETLAEFERQAVMLRLLYKRAIPPDAGEAVRLAVKFLNCGAPPDALDQGADGVQGADEQAHTQSARAKNESPRLYSFVTDAPLIYAALRRTYGQDVLAGPMHWYRFAALFSDLSGDTFFARLLYLRRGRLAGTLTPDERRVAAALGSYLAVPAPRTAQPDEDAQEFFRAYRGAQERHTAVPAAEGTAEEAGVGNGTQE
ncbi:MAG: Gp15 family bacteriophage protein [Ruthenibacterium sp.]